MQGRAPSDRIIRSSEQARRGRVFRGFADVVQNRRPTEQARRRRCPTSKSRVARAVPQPRRRCLTPARFPPLPVFLRSSCSAAWRGLGPTWPPRGNVACSECNSLPTYFPLPSHAVESNTYLTVSQPGSQTCRESRLMGVTNRFTNRFGSSAVHVGRSSRCRGVPQAVATEGKVDRASRADHDSVGLYTLGMSAELK